MLGCGRTTPIKILSRARILSTLLAALSLQVASARQQGLDAALDIGPGPTSSAHGPSIVLFHQVKVAANVVQGMLTLSHVMLAEDTYQYVSVQTERNG